MIIPLMGLLALISPLFTGGRLRRFGDVRLRQAIVLPIALISQIVIIEVIPEANHAALSAVHIATYVAAGWFVWVNRAIPGLWIIALGAASNGITIALNGGTLPARLAALEGAGLPVDRDRFVNSGVMDHARLPWLGDVFYVPKGVPLANVFSVGDVLLVVGAFVVVHSLARRAPVPVEAADGDPESDTSESAGAESAAA